jgi:hypothetical protein
MVNDLSSEILAWAILEASQNNNDTNTPASQQIETTLTSPVQLHCYSDSIARSLN